MSFTEALLEISQDTRATYTTISQCRICGNEELDAVLDLGVQALTGIFPKNREAETPRCPLELVKCHDDGSGQTCGLVQLRHSCQPDAMYGMNYGYRSGLNQSMVDHLQRKANKIKSAIPLTPGDLILDIGSNDGTLLRAMDGPGLRLVGMDPVGIKFRQYYPPNAQLIPDFFSGARFRKEFGRQSAKVVTSIAMFYDLESPLEFMRQVYEVLSEDGIWVFEQSYLPAMLASVSYDTICHEHVEYYALKQILWMLKRVGFRALDAELNDVNGGSFSITAAKKSAGYEGNEAAIQNLIREENRIELSGTDIYRKFRERVYRHRAELRQFLGKARHEGKRIFGYGASTKGNVLLQFCGITAEGLPCIAEVNNDKFGAFTPGTRIPIISEEEARSMNPSGFMVLPWHFRDNIIARERNFLAAGGKLIFPLPNIEVVGN
jgi:NDP-4-keto-2,6-dideoxyhexose 3-C-methyltransferase